MVFKKYHQKVVCISCLYSTDKLANNLFLTRDLKAMFAFVCECARARVRSASRIDWHQYLRSNYLLLTVKALSHQLRITRVIIRSLEYPVILHNSIICHIVKILTIPSPLFYTTLQIVT